MFFFNFLDSFLLSFISIHVGLLCYRVTDTETETSREVIQFHYTTWPDFGVPTSPTAFLEFLYKVRASGAMDSNAGPPIVHCSAGVGRSGTFCLVDSCLVMVYFHYEF